MSMNQMNKKFAAIILTHGRPEKVVTYKTLRDNGYTGKIVILVDNMDKSISRYKEIYGDEVYVFDKQKIKDKSESGNNFNDFRSTIFPRNAMLDVAKDLQLTSYIQLDDDYTSFRYKFDGKFQYIDSRLDKIKNLDRLFDLLSDFVESTSVTSLCFAQGGDFIGGKNSGLSQKVKTKRKGMNSFVCATSKPFMFFGQLNEDVNTVVLLGSRGHIFLMTNQIALEQFRTQTNSGGMSDIYLDSGTYIKTFYSVMYHPSSVKVHYLNSSNKRIHHRVSWKHTAPKIISETLKKSSKLR